MTEIPTVGTVIHGSDVTHVLLVTFANALERYGEDHPEHLALTRAARGQAKALDQPTVTIESITRANDLLNDLYDALDAIAGQHGLSFGALHSDGGDFGFWPTPKEPTTTKTIKLEGSAKSKGGGSTHNKTRIPRAPKTLNPVITIALSDEDYQKLYAMRQPGETESDIIARLIHEHDLPALKHIPWSVCLKLARKRYHRRHQTRRNRTMIRTPVIGTVSHGTLATQDLLRAFAGALETYGSANEEEGALIKEARDFAVELDEDPDQLDVDEDEGSELLEELTDALDAIAARHGMYFGATEGDGSDFGFWPIPESDENQS